MSEITKITESDEKAIVAEAEAAVETVAKAREAISKVIYGQTEVVENTLTTIFAGGHALLVGVPGLAKTLLVSTVAKTLSMGFKRIHEEFFKTLIEIRETNLTEAGLNVDPLMG